MKAVICLMSACVLTASMAQAQAPAPAAEGGQKIPLSEGLRRSYNTVKMNLTESAQKLGEADYSYRPSPDIRTCTADSWHMSRTHNSTRAQPHAARRIRIRAPISNRPRHLERTSFRRSPIRLRSVTPRLRTSLIRARSNWCARE